MAKYRKKPIYVEAEQWHGMRTDGPTPTPRGVYHDNNIGFHVMPISFQKVPIKPGDWIILEVKQPAAGMTYAYPCDPELFELLFEKAD